MCQTEQTYSGRLICQIFIQLLQKYTNSAGTAAVVIRVSADRATSNISNSCQIDYTKILVGVCVLCWHVPATCANWPVLFSLKRLT